MFCPCSYVSRMVPFFVYFRPSSFYLHIQQGTQQNRSTNVLLMGVTGLDAPPGVLCGTVALLVQLALAERAAKVTLMFI